MTPAALSEANNLTPKQRTILVGVWRLWAARERVTLERLAAETGVSTLRYHLYPHPERTITPSLVERGWVAWTGDGTIRPGPRFAGIQGTTILEAK